ncbi:MAG: ATP-binding protein [Desulfobulbaceae bacterium]|nr:ATP-binding protein [Desulfobulbaceae bacterium]
MIISVASGKGGTGKTTVSTNLAVSVDQPVQLLDCDVEEPNAHLFIHPSFHKSETIWTPVPEVDEKKCTLWKKCSDICQFKAIVVIGKTVLPFHEMCHSCGGCMEVCPENAITEIGRELGVIEMGARNGLEFIHGRLRIGEAMSPPLIRAVRAQAKKDRLTIIDAPPGTSCPVIAAMKGADFVLLVTEPTPFGLHDLILAVEAVKILGIPSGLVINRSDLGDDRVRDYAREEGLPILMEIPFDRRIAVAYSTGELLVDVLPEYREQFRNLHDRIQDIVNRNRTIQRV